MTFWGGQFFVSKDTGKHINSGTKITAPIIRQIQADGKTVIIFRTLRLIILIGICVVLSCALLVYAFLNGNWMYAWAYINTMQILTHTPLFAVPMPGDLSFLLAYLMSFFRFSFWSSKCETWLGNMFNMPYSENHYSEIFEYSGYRTVFAVRMLGSLYFVFLILATMAALSFALWAITRKIKSHKLYVLYKWVYFLTFNSGFATRFMLEATLEFFIVAFIGL